MTDRRILYAAAFLRALSAGLLGVLLAFHLPTLGISKAEIGWIVGAGLAGGGLATLYAMSRGDRLDRRKTLFVYAALTAAGAVAFALSSSLVLLVVTAFFGMSNAFGRDRGAMLVLDTAILPSTAADSERTRVFAWYSVCQDAGLALGALLAAVPDLLHRVTGVPEAAASRIGVGIPAALSLVVALLYLRLSPRSSPPSRDPSSSAAPPLSSTTRSRLWRISSLFALDSLGGGFLGTTLLGVFFKERFGASIWDVAWLFLAARAANAFSHLVAARLARRFGLVNTMVFTHVPSSLLLATAAFAPSFPVAAALLLLREGLVEMDVPTRQSYVMAIVAPHERTVASGVTNLVRVGGWAVGSATAGLLMQASVVAAILAGCVMKLGYDALLYFAFRRVRPPEEAALAMPGGRP